MRGKQSTDELMTCFRQGDDNAFRDVYYHFHRQLFYFTAKLIASDEAEAYDIVSETFRKLWQRRANFETLANVKAFLYITARNNCFNYLKYNKRRKANQEQYGKLVDHSEESVVSLIVQTELLTQIQEEIEKLPDQRKQVIKLFYFEGLNTEEIANKLNMRPGTVRMNKLRAISELRKKFRKSEWQLLILWMLTFDEMIPD